MVECLKVVFGESIWGFSKILIGSSEFDMYSLAMG